MEKILLRRSASGESRARRIWLFLVLILCGVASVAQAQVANLPTTHSGRWTTVTKAGWSYTGLGTDNTINLGNTTDNATTTRSANFDTEGDIMLINFSGITNQSPGEFSYHIAYVGSSPTFTGEMLLEQSVNGSDWSPLQTINSSSGVKRVTQSDPSVLPITATPNSTSRYLRLRATSVPTGVTNILIDKVTLSPRPAAPEINIVVGNTTQANGTTYTFTEQQNINTSSHPVTFTIQNNGDSPLSITTPLALSGTNADQFEVIGTPSSSLAAGATTSFQIVFKPTTATIKSAEVSIVNNDSDENPYTINFSGRGAILAPIITGFEPDAGTVGSTIIIRGSNFTNAQTVIFSNGTPEGKTATLTRIDDNTISATVPTGAQTGKIKLSYNNTLTSESNGVFTVISTPIITDFSPKTGPVGTMVTVTGANFTAGGGLLFKDAAGEYLYSEGYELVSSTEIRGKVPQGAVTGAISVEDDNGAITESDENFTVTIPEPVITSIDPESGPTGTLITVNGSNLKGIRSITFGGVLAPEYDDTEEDKLYVYVPEGAQSGLMIVSTAGGSAQSNFTVTIPKPIITDFSPKTGPVGTMVTVTGANFTAGGGLLFKDAAGEYLYSEGYELVSSTEIRGKVPQGAVTGAISVEDDNGAITESDENFTVTIPEPVITSVSPNFGPAGTVVAVRGTDLNNISSVTFNGVPASFYETEEGFTTVVPEDATAGPIIVKTAGGTTEGDFLVLTTTLPVELVDFTAKSTATSVILNWKTASEKNNAYFEVQASANPTSEVFKTVQKVGSKVTNSSTTTSYEAEDHTAKDAVTYYRLKQVDLDGKAEFSKTIAVEKLLSNKTAASIKAYPNPFDDSRNLNIEVVTEKSGQLTVTLSYVTGKKAFEQVYNVEAGTSTFELPVNNSSLSIGMYILTTKLNGEITTTRVIKK